MADFSSLFVSREGAPLKVGDQTIIVVSRALRLFPPMGFVGAVWNRPVAVKVLTPEGVEHVLPIVDETRRRQAIIALFGLAAAMILLLVSGPRRQR